MKNTISSLLPFKTKITYLIFCLILMTIVIVSVIMAIFIGSVNINSSLICKIIVNNALGHEFFTNIWTKSIESIIWDIRLPRVLLSAIVGAGLALCGIGMQALTKNSLADPYILGISSGASTGAVASMLFGFLGFLSGYSTMIGAFIGAIVAIVIVFNIASIKGHLTSTRLVLSGVAVSAVFSALTNFMVFKADDSNRVNSALFWMVGSLSGTKWNYIPYIFMVFIICALLLFVMNKALDVLLLGDEAAITLGVNISILKIVIIIICTLLTSSIVSVSGVVGFVGLVIPHISRTFVGSKHKRLIPASILLGALFLIWADVCARLIVVPEELPIGIVTSFIGAPFFLWLLRKSSYSFGGSK